MRIVITKGRHILNCDEIESEGKRIEINIGDISNCVSVSAKNDVICNKVDNQQQKNSFSFFGVGTMSIDSIKVKQFSKIKHKQK